MPFEGIVYDPHARQRTAERHVREADVVATLEHPDALYPPYRGRPVADRRDASGEIVRVFYVEEPADTGVLAYVITVTRVGSEP